jgi:hypothetical protein
MLKHWFWNLISAASVLWYSTITILVAVKGAKDIKTMLAALGKTKDQG